jgi:tetratricopeptide (TPR) repeat protein
MRRTGRAVTPKKRAVIPKNAFDERFAGQNLQDCWEKLHKGDQEQYPDTAWVTRLAKRYPKFGAWIKSHGGAGEVAAGVQEAWRRFHAGDFTGAIDGGGKLGALGATPANKAAAIHSQYAQGDEAHRLALLTGAMKRGEQAIELLPDYPNAHYMLALVMGRYSQRISILKALADGIAARVRTHLDATLELEPRHAEAHIALGMYHAEIVAKIGSLLAGLTYGATREAAMEHFGRALQLTPGSPIAHIEYANGLLLLDAAGNRAQARKLYARAAACAAADAMEQLDVQRAQHPPA